MKPRLLYACDFMPGADSGGALVIDRHLRRLAQEGWDVTISVPSPAIKSAPRDSPWTVRPFASRRFWWPPANPRWPWTLRLRAALWARAIRAAPGWTSPPDTILTVLWGPAALTAALLASAWRTPLAVIVHDRFREMNLSPDAARAGKRLERDVLAAAARTWPVSDEMRDQLASLCAGAITTLPPVPAQGIAPSGGWSIRFRPAPVVAHAGAFHSHHVEYLAAVARALSKFDGTLLVLTPAENPALAQLRATGVAFRHQPSFNSSPEALAFLAAEASALTVMYPFDPASYKSPPSGFPSRLIEFSHLGLPILLAAPPGNPMNNWARRHSWPFLLERANWPALEALMAQLADSAAWQALSKQMRSLAATVCDPETIHRQFLAELPRRVVNV